MNNVKQLAIPEGGNAAANHGTAIMTAVASP